MEGATVTFIMLLKTNWKHSYRKFLSLYIHFIIAILFLIMSAVVQPITQVLEYLLPYHLDL